MGMSEVEMNLQTTSQFLESGNSVMQNGSAHRSGIGEMRMESQQPTESTVPQAIPSQTSTPVVHQLVVPQPTHKIQSQPIHFQRLISQSTPTNTQGISTPNTGGTPIGPNSFGSISGVPIPPDMAAGMIGIPSFNFLPGGAPFLPQLMYPSSSGAFVGTPLSPFGPVGIPPGLMAPYPLVASRQSLPVHPPKIAVATGHHIQQPMQLNENSYVGQPMRSCRLRRNTRHKSGDSESSEESAEMSETETSDSELQLMTDSDDTSDSDFGGRRKTRRKGPISKGPGRPRLGAGTKRPKGRPNCKDSDDSDGSFSFNRKRTTRQKFKSPIGALDDDSIGGSNRDSDSSYSSGGARNRKRRRASPSPDAAVRRSCSRHPAKSQRFTYAALGDHFESDLEDRETEALLAAEKVAQQEGPGVDRVLGYRRIDSEDNEASLVPVPIPVGSNSTTINDYVFLIKWLRKSHLHNSWECCSNLAENGIAGVRKVENFYRRMETLRLDRLRMTEDEIEQQDVEFELRKQLDQDCLIAERILAYKQEVPQCEERPNNSSPKIKSTEVSDNESQLITDSLKCDTSQVSDEIVTDNNKICLHPDPSESQEPIEYYLVKWSNSPYDQTTWEKKETLLNHGFGDLINQYEERESTICGYKSAKLPLHTHDLSRTSFEPYTSTPSYLRQGEGNEDRSLRDYQIVGLNWMISRMKKGLSVLLADEMGLGKTVQTISVFGHLMYHELLTGPFLVIVPQSTIDNWLSEFKRWLPFANVIVYHGNPQARDLIRTYEMAKVRAQPFTNCQTSDPKVVGARMPAPNRRLRLRCDVCIATPSILNNLDDLDFLRRTEWYLMAIDEAHLLKNRESKRFKELSTFRTRYRLLLSGTPLHNNLEEMWSLLHFLSPTTFHDVDDFKRKFSEIEKTDSVGELKEKQLAQLQKDLHELVLRRVKKDVEKSLPKKTERILRVEVSPMQAQCCEAIIARNYDVLAKSNGGKKASLQNICMELKKVCNHPLLVGGSNNWAKSWMLQTDRDIVELQSNSSAQGRQEWHQILLHSSGKLALLDKLLPYLKEKGHRVLIFSQMVRMLNILSSYLILRGFRHQRLDGTMGREVRKKAMDHFNSPDSDDFCFLLSTKAGGLGINLTTADTVIIYDSDWNPQNDLQAEARAHRIGQTKTVQIYRLVTKGTVEEKILERAKAKMVLDTLVVQGLNKKSNGGTLSSYDAPNGSSVLKCGTQIHKDGFSFSREELTKILKFGATKLWRARDVSNSGINGEVRVDLNKILAEAEERDSDGQGGLADELLSSFTNISDFRYEAPPDPPEVNDKDFWENTIPLEERLKYEALDPSMDIIGKKRNRKQVERVTPGTPLLEFSNLDDGDYEDSVTTQKGKKGGKKGTKGRVEKVAPKPKPKSKSTKTSKITPVKTAVSTVKKEKSKKRKVKIISDDEENESDDEELMEALALSRKRGRESVDNFLPEDFLSDGSFEGCASDDSAYGEKPKAVAPPKKRKKTEAKPKRAPKKAVVAESTESNVRPKRKATPKKGSKTSKAQQISTVEPAPINAEIISRDNTADNQDTAAESVVHELPEPSADKPDFRIPRRSTNSTNDATKDSHIKLESDTVKPSESDVEKIPKRPSESEPEKNAEFKMSVNGVDRIPRRITSRRNEENIANSIKVASKQLSNDVTSTPTDVIINETDTILDGEMVQEPDPPSPMTDVDQSEEVYEPQSKNDFDIPNHRNDEYKLDSSAVERNKNRSYHLADEYNTSNNQRAHNRAKSGGDFAIHDEIGIKSFLKQFGHPSVRPRRFRELFGCHQPVSEEVEAILRYQSTSELSQRIALLEDLGRVLSSIANTDVHLLFDSHKGPVGIESRLLHLAARHLSQRLRNGFLEGLDSRSLAILWIAIVKYGLSDYLVTRDIPNESTLHSAWNSDIPLASFSESRLFTLMVRLMTLLHETCQARHPQRFQRAQGDRDVEAGECSEGEIEMEYSPQPHSRVREFNSAPSHFDTDSNSLRVPRSHMPPWAERPSPKPPRPMPSVNSIAMHRQRPPAIWNNRRSDPSPSPTEPGVTLSRGLTGYGQASRAIAPRRRSSPHKYVHSSDVNTSREMNNHTQNRNPNTNLSSLHVEQRHLSQYSMSIGNPNEQRSMEARHQNERNDPWETENSIPRKPSFHQFEQSIPPSGSEESNRLSISPPWAVPTISSSINIGRAPWRSAENCG